MNYQTFSAYIIVYQLIQVRCPISDNPLEKRLRKRASIQNELTLVNYKVVLEQNT